jgi:hypothetical protein
LDESVGSSLEYVQPLALNDWMAFDRPGPYQVEIRLTAPFVSASGPLTGPPSETLTLDIRPRDAVVLEHTYAELVDAYLNGAGEQRWYAAQVLRHLTDPLAVPMLRRILDSTDADAYIYIVLDILRKIGTPDAVAVLQEAAATGSTERAALAKNALERFRLGIKHQSSRSSRRGGVMDLSLSYGQQSFQRRSVQEPGMAARALLAALARAASPQP